SSSRAPPSRNRGIVSRPMPPAAPVMTRSLSANSVTEPPSPAVAASPRPSRKMLAGGTAPSQTDKEGREDGMVQEVLLVTGGSRGIGAATALLAARRGYAVAIGYATRVDRAEAVAEQIRAAGGRAAAIRADLADAGSIEPMFA